jgi:hypothetical protein
LESLAESSGSVRLSEAFESLALILPLEQLNVEGLLHEPFGANWFHEPSQCVGLQKDGCSLKPTNRWASPQVDKDTSSAQSIHSIVDPDSNKTGHPPLENGRPPDGLGKSTSWTSLLLGRHVTPKTVEAETSESAPETPSTTPDTYSLDLLQEQSTRTSSMRTTESNDSREASDVKSSNSTHDSLDKLSTPLSFRQKFISSKSYRDDDVVQIAISHSSDLLATLHKNNLIKIWKNDSPEGDMQTPRVVTLNTRKRFSLYKRPSEVDHVAFSSVDAFIFVDVQRGSTSAVELWDWEFDRMIDRVPIELCAQNLSFAGTYTLFANGPSRIAFYEATTDGLGLINQHKLNIPPVESSLQVIGFCQNTDVNDVVMAMREGDDAVALSIVRTPYGNMETKRTTFKELRAAYPLGVASDNRTIWSIWEDWHVAYSSWYILSCDLATSKLELIELRRLTGYILRLSPNGEYLAAWRNGDQGSLLVLDGKTGQELAVLEKTPLVGQKGDMITVAQFSVDSKLLVVAYVGGYMQSYEIKDQAKVGLVSSSVVAK